MDSEDRRYAAKLSKQIFNLIARTPASQETLTQELEIEHPDLAAEVEKLHTPLWRSLRHRLKQAFRKERNEYKRNRPKRRKPTFSKQEHETLECVERCLDDLVDPVKVPVDREDLLQLIEQSSSEAQTFFGEFKSMWNKKRIRIEVKKMSDAAIRFLVTKLKAAANIKNKEERLSTQLTDILTKKFPEEDIDLDEFVLWDKNNYGIKIYMCGEAYLFDFEGTINELAEGLIEEIEAHLDDKVACPYCEYEQPRHHWKIRSKHPQDPRRGDDCPCGAITFRERSKPSDIRKQMKELGAIEAKSSDDEWSLWFYKEGTEPINPPKPESEPEEYGRELYGTPSYKPGTYEREDYHPTATILYEHYKTEIEGPNNNFLRMVGIWVADEALHGQETEVEYEKGEFNYSFRVFKTDRPHETKPEETVEEFLWRPSGQIAATYCSDAGLAAEELEEPLVRYVRDLISAWTDLQLNSLSFKDIDDREKAEFDFTEILCETDVDADWLAAQLNHLLVRDVIGCFGETARQREEKRQERTQERIRERKEATKRREVLLEKPLALWKCHIGTRTKFIRPEKDEVFKLLNCIREEVKEIPEAFDALIESGRLSEYFSNSLAGVVSRRYRCLDTDSDVLQEVGLPIEW